MIYLDNKYTLLYYKIINKAKSRILPKEIITENHHIIPESFYIKRTRKGEPGWLEGNSDDLNNIVILTLREHFICHRLLIKMTEGIAKAKAAKAIWHMTLCGKYKINSHNYEISRQNFILSISGKNNKNYGKTGELSHLYNIPKSNETKEKMSFSAKEYITNHPEARQKRSQRILGENNPNFGKTGELSCHYNKTWLEEYGEEKSNNMRQKISIANGDPEIYFWIHNSGITETCTRRELIKKYNLSLHCLSEIVNRKIKTHLGWGLIPIEEREYKQQGKNHSRYNLTIYHWKNLNAQEEFCSAYELRTKFNLDSSSISKLVLKKIKSHRGWSIIES